MALVSPEGFHSVIPLEPGVQNTNKYHQAFWLVFKNIVCINVANL